MIERIEINTIASRRKKKFLGISYGELVKFEKILWIDIIEDGKEITLSSKSFNLKNVWESHYVTGLPTDFLKKKEFKHREGMRHIHKKLLAKLEKDVSSLLYLMHIPFNYSNLKALLSTYGHTEKDLRTIVEIFKLSNMQFKMQEIQRIEKIGYKL